MPSCGSPISVSPTCASLTVSGVTKKRRDTWTFDGTGEPSPGADGTTQLNTRSLTAAEMDVVFQPIVDLSTGKQFGLEALARCKRPALKDPVILFKQAVRDQSTGFMGRIIREVAFARCEGIPLFVNLHPEELSARWLVRPDDPMNFYDAPVFLEITETAAFQYFDLCQAAMAEVCSRCGARLVIDDFGAGYSNLKRVIDLRPAIVKLDRDLVTGIDQDERQLALVSYVVKLCYGLGAKVVAEGIETVEELKAIRATGAHYGQGYLLARPAFPIPEVNWPLTADGRRRPSGRPRPRSSGSLRAVRASKPPPSDRSGDLPMAKRRSTPPRRQTKRPPPRSH
jgi:EAL domain-containing protein (putative c-di-GMP-specific phosphodiesterase class I)